MTIEDAITHLQIAKLVLAYAKADAFHGMNSLGVKTNADAGNFIISRLDAAAKATDVALVILEEPRFAATLGLAA